MNNIPNIEFNRLKPSKIEGFEVLDLETLQIKNKHSDHDPYAYHRLTFYVIFIITQGEVQHWVDFNSCQLKTGDSLLVSKGQIHAFDKKSNYQGYLVVFTDAFLLKHLSNSMLHKLEYLFDTFSGIKSFHSPTENNTLINVLNTELNSAPKEIAADLTSSLLSIYLLKLLVKNKDVNPILLDKNQEVFNKFRALVEKNYTQTRDAKKYASDLHISYKHLNTICKAITKNTAKAFIDNFVILEGKRYLVASTDTVKEISYQLGFDEPTNFQKFFKKHTQLTAKEFRSHY
ncbi:AraC-like DNA-binding protein [Wenyingzhuangia heitensis]|uniref:AraC-like DNA-binding protein n=1 Tax=Wenyingzhuangia heitensis TaxID=1487859 RepID=A0ABX0UBH4_9FLAO|nr:helix-turn-helix transcriptional regulator [Wenyingzhuangia heitensis]NIJ45633.1 AraC-like DNA-binding protein [Wenyingzhuangia heitensis]